MSDSLQNFGLQPSRVLCPWDRPGKNAGVGCHFPGDLLNQGWNPGLLHCRRILPAEPPGKPKNTGVGSLFLLRGIFPTQESNQGLPHWQVDSLPSEPSGKPHGGVFSYNPSQANEAHTVCMSLGNMVLSEISQTQKQPDILHLDQVCSSVIPFLPHSTKKKKQRRKQISSCERLGPRKGFSAKAHEGMFQGKGNIFYLHCAFKSIY